MANRVPVVKTHTGQSIELPPEFGMDADWVEIIRQGDSILLVPVRTPSRSFANNSADYEEWWDDLSV